MKKDKAVRKAEIKAAIKKQIKSLIGPFVVLAIIAAVALFIVFYKEEEEQPEIIKVNSYEGSEKELVLENDDLKLVMDSTSTQFKIITKSNGAEWYSNPTEAASDELALAAEKDKLRSTLILTYSTVNGVDTLFNNYTYSMEKGIYDIEMGEDYIKVYYSIGDTDKEYIIPPVIRKERMEELLSLMDKGEATRISDYYKEYDINNLGKKDNAEELLANYPILAEEIVYVLRSTAKDNIKSKMEGYFEAAGYTVEEYAQDKALDMSTTTSNKPVFNVNVIYRLDGEDLIVEIPMSEIEYKEDYPIYYLNVLPYFGAGSTEDEGYLLVPEGGGGIINFNNGKTAQNSYYANLYGWDMAQDRDAVVHETRTYYNVFGEAKADSSFYCVIEEGAPYASIQADISGKSNSYNYVNAIYNLVHREQYDVSDRTNAEMYVYESELPDESIVQRYCFVDSGEYSQMAQSYQNYLLESYSDYMSLNMDTDVPAAIEIVGAVDKVKQVLGIPVSKPLQLTTFTEAENIVSELYADGVQNMSVKLTGWINGGVQQKILKRTKLVSELGSKKELQSLVNSAIEQNINIYLDGITNYAYDSDLWDGFFLFTDAAKFVSKDKAELYTYNTVSYNAREGHDSHYLLKGTEILTMADNLIKSVNTYNANVSFSDYGYELSSDFSRKNFVSRQAAMTAQANQLAEASAGGTKVMINMGNDYAVAYCDMVVNMDLNGSEYTIIDETVPFYQMALHGYVNYTGESINLTQNGEEELLKSAEYGAGLSFTLMNETAFALQNTLYTEYFGADYSAYHDKLVSIYTRYNEELGHVFNQKMINHEYLSSKLTCTTYEDGTKVYVNYSYAAEQTDDGIEVSARDYLVQCE